MDDCSPGTSSANAPVILQGTSVKVGGSTSSLRNLMADQEMMTPVGDFLWLGQWLCVSFNPVTVSAE